MHYFLILIGALILYWYISKLLRQSKSKGLDNVIRYGFAVILGVLSLVLLIRGNIAGALVLATGAVLSWQGSLWSYLASRAGAQNERQGSLRGNSDMSRADALDVLGLKGRPSEEEIKQAYHRMIKKIHPDQGGSDYLAAQINHAKDLLLGQL